MSGDGDDLLSQSLRTLPEENVYHIGHYFVADLDGIMDISPKDEIYSMQHPLFSLRTHDRQKRTFRAYGRNVVLKPGADGCATIHDKDLWIFCISQLAAAINRGYSVSPHVRFMASDFLKAARRGTNGRSYERMIMMLQRLSGTRIEMSMKKTDIPEDHPFAEAGEFRRGRMGFGLIEEWEVREKDRTGRIVSIDVRLPHFLMRSLAKWHVLTISPDYFDIRSPLGRRVYEIARKHCGHKSEWKIGLEPLLIKSGSIGTLKRFRHNIIKLVEPDRLPDYHISYARKTDQVTFRRRKNITPAPPDSPAGKRPMDFLPLRQRGRWNSE